MRKHIDLYYKSYDGNYSSEMDRLLNERFNEYGYNFESNRKKTISLDQVACKSGPLCLSKRINGEKR